MSEFSESYHLEADAQQDGVGLLQRAGLAGWVFPPKRRWPATRGWVTILPRSRFGEPPAALIEANQGWLLQYLLDQDAGWMFAVYSGPVLTSRYECRWLDWSDPENRIKTDAGDVDVEAIWALAKRHGRNPQLLELKRILHPRVVRQTDRETGAQWDSFADWPVEKLDDNVAYAFARLLALPHYVWLRWRDDMSNDIECLREGAVKVGFGS